MSFMSSDPERESYLLTWAGVLAILTLLWILGARS
jgi:hypothetical protein